MRENREKNPPFLAGTVVDWGLNDDGQLGSQPIRLKHTEFLKRLFSFESGILPITITMLSRVCLTPLFSNPS